ncbi:MAG: chromosome segregation protein SMC [Huintestinicola sp.]
MYLKSLEIQGFKSFPDKITLDFGKGITAVVGPNGSGKSNIGDAVRWVLGEQSSKTLRGSKMEDVIFAGTQMRKPMGFASVTLNIVNDKGLLNIDADEVSVTRKLYRSGESEYRINGAAVRLKDICELFMDTGLGRDGYSIIGQGRVAEIVSAKSGERREIFEEAAGISKFRYRKAEAQRRLAAAEDNILRLKDIIGELESRVEPLRKQSEKAQQFIELSEQKKSYEITVWMNRLSELKANLTDIGDKILINSAEYESTEADISRLEEELRIVYKSTAEGNIRIEQLRNAVLEAERSNTALHSDIAVYKNDIEHCTAAIKELEEQAENAKNSDSENKRLTEEKLEKIKETEKLISEADEKIEAISAKLSEASEMQSGFDKEYSEKSAALGKLYIKQSEYNITISSAEQNLKDMTDRIEKEKQALENAEKSAEGLEAEKKEVTDGLALLDEKKAEQTNRISGLNRLYSSKSEKYGASAKEQNDLEFSIRDKEQRAKLLRDLENSMEGFGNAVKKILTAGKSGRISGITGSVAQLISVPKEYTLAVETALGGALQNIVTENEDAAKRSIRLLKEMNAGRATFLPVTSVKGNRLNEQGLEGCTGFVALACDIVSFDQRFTGIVNSLLGRTVVAEDIDSAAAIAKKYGYRFRIVTLDGQVVNAGGSFTGGSANRSSGVLTRKNDIERLEQELKDSRSQLEEVRRRTAALKAEADKLHLDIEAANDEIRMIEQDRIRFEAEIKRIEQVAASSEQAKQNGEENIRRLEQKYAETKQNAQTAAEALRQTADLIAEAEAAISRQDAEKDRLRSEREGYAAELSDIKIRRTELEKDKQTLIDAVAQLEEQSRNLGDAGVRTAMAIDEQKRIIEEKQRLIGEREKSLSSASRHTADINAKITETQSEILKQEQRSNEIRSEVKKLTDSRERFGAEKTRLDERRKAFQASYDGIVKDMAEQYELYPSEAAAFVIENGDKLEITAKLNELKQKIRSLGTVNVAAIEEYKEVSERYEFMSGQLSDVESSKRELERLIGELTENMKKLFSESFVQINDNFKRIFVELFGGGRAELVLTDPSDVLESGIEINVAPPGKVIKNLSLLSGGEQAFVAIAIYFAILTIRPAPFCILDEIEAALDDVNVSKYAHYLRNFTDTTQFIAVTHRRGTMEEADVMYGVTMQEKGISRLLKMEQPPAEDMAAE